MDGISIPDAASFQPRDIEKAGPGKPFLGSSAVRGGLHYKTMQVLANILEFDMDPQAGGVQDGTFDPKVLDGVAALGIKVNILS